MPHISGARERTIARQSEPLREFFSRIQPGYSYSPAETGPAEQQRLVELYRLNWGRTEKEDRTLTHFSAFRSSSMIKPKGSRLFLMPQLRFLPTVQHTHDYFEFGLLLEGRCRHFVQDVQLEMCAGDAVLIPPGTKHQPAMLTDTCVWYDLGIRADKLPAVLPHLWNEDTPLAAFLRGTQEIVSNKAYGFFHLEPAWLNRTVEMFSRVAISEKDGLNRRREELLAELIVAELAASPAIQLVPNDAESAGSDDSIIRYINGHFRTANRAALAEHFSYSERQITRIVQRCTGRSLQEYLCDVRMAYITDMLEHTMAPVHEIIEAAGYHNNNNFFTLFRARCGMTPGEYRRQKQAGQTNEH
ncbi:MAG: helix-turn-helix domain-containing protein [Oscillospiraceae bacterium]|nr:helix-turn-helix domain-containing protein [Oscillospiraceae bacterium]